MAIEQSLFKACLKTYQNGVSGTQNVGGTDIYIERYSQKDINNNVSMGSTDQSRIVLICDGEITIPSGRTITPANPKKSLVIMCNKLVNNGTISMTAKAPNTLPHNYLLLQKTDRTGFYEDVLIPAYANNGLPFKDNTGETVGKNGNNGTNRQCGSGGTGGGISGGDQGASGSGFAFGGGAGSAGGVSSAKVLSVDSTYPMRGVDGVSVSSTYDWIAYGGVGNPAGKIVKKNSFVATQNFGCGGRVIIFCNEFENNGTITANGTNGTSTSYKGGSNIMANGGASGGGAIDIFYTSLISRGSTVASGGVASTISGVTNGGNGGNGSITLSQWTLQKVVREQRKKFTQPNWLYLFGEYASRLSEDI